MVNSTVDFVMVSTRKKKQQNRRLLSQLIESDADFMVGQSSHEAQTKNRANLAHRDFSLNDTNDPLKLVVHKWICTHFR